MKPIRLIGALCLGALAFATDVSYNFDRTANFSNYRTYRWAEAPGTPAANQLLDQNIRQSIDAQLALKGLRRVDSSADLLVSYQTAVDQEKQFDGWGSGPRWYGNTRVTTSTIDVGKIVVSLFDVARKQLVWRGGAQKTLDIKKDPEKNYHNLQKTMAKLFKHYPPGAEKN